MLYILLVASVSISVLFQQLCDIYLILKLQCCSSIFTMVSNHLLHSPPEVLVENITYVHTSILDFVVLCCFSSLLLWHFVLWFLSGALIIWCESPHKNNYKMMKSYKKHWTYHLQYLIIKSKQQLTKGPLSLWGTWVDAATGCLLQHVHPGFMLHIQRCVNNIAQKWTGLIMTSCNSLAKCLKVECHLPITGHGFLTALC